MSEEKLEEINTIAEFMEKLNKVKELERYKNLKQGNGFQYTIDLFYRGHSDSEYELIPSIGREAKKLPLSVNAAEVALINKAKNEYPVLFSETDNPLDLLVKLQHYGIPTRLLDITANPLVALYFACEDKNNFNDNNNGEVFVIGNQYETYFEHPLFHYIAKHMSRADNFAEYKISIRNFYLELVTPKKINELNVDSFIQSNHGDKLIKKMLEGIYFIYPPRLFERLYIQQGYFILFLNNYIYDENNSEIYKIRHLSPIPKDYKNIIARYVIPAESKKHLLEELKMLNITESTLFHDDVDTVCKNIVADFKRRYDNR